MLFNFFFRFLIAFTTLGLGCFAELTNAETKVIDRIYLIVNSQMLTRSEAHDVLLAMQAQKSSAKKTQKQLAEQLMMSLVQEMLLLDRAKSLKIEPGGKEIETRLDQIAEEQPQLLDIYTEDDLKEQLARDYKKQRVISREVDSKIHVESREIELFCEQQLRKNRKVGLAQILLHGPEKEVQEQVKTIRQAFKNGVSFEELAKLHSADSSAKRTGGKLGIFKPGDLLTEIGAVTKILRAGEISDVVETSLGKHLLYIYKEEFAEELNCAKLSIDQNTKYSNELYSQKRKTILDTYMNELYACANIEIKDPGSTGLPISSSLPKVEEKNINCQARRVMVIPQKKKKEKKKKRK